jgi:hypothetical protein
VKKRTPVAEKLARRILTLSGRRQQATGEHCELSGIWESPSGVRVTLHEGQLLPSDRGRACRWTHLGHGANPWA